MNLSDNELIYEKYLLCELFNNSYPLKEITAVFAAGREERFPNFDKIFNYHLKYKTKNPVYYIKCYFENKTGEEIEAMIYPSTLNGNLFIEDVLETFVILFRPKIDKFKHKTSSFDATSVVSTVMNITIMFLNSYKKCINKTTKDWENRTKNGIIRFDVLPNYTMNKISKQIRTKKEEDRGFSQRENLYKRAFDKIVKPIYPELSIQKHLTYFLIKS